MKMIKTQRLTAVSAALLVTLSNVAWASEPAAQTSVADNTELAAHCTHTSTTPIIPDGNIASMDELASAQTRVKAFQEELLDFRECLLEVESGLDTEADDFEIKKAALTARANGSIDLETGVADEFNEAIRIYKSR